MRVTGYRLSGYDATYKKTSFFVTERSEDVYEIEDAESGTTFILDFEGVKYQNQKPRTGIIRDRNTGSESGISIAFGSRGILQKLKYCGRKPKNSI